MSSVGDELTSVVRGLVEHSEAVELEEVNRAGEVFFELRVAAQDLGKVIGRQGRTVRALRTLLEARGEAENVRYSLEILDE